MEESPVSPHGDESEADDVSRQMAERTRASSRTALIEAALDEFSTKGYEAATVAGIAERAGVTTGALYAHFEGKLDLLVDALGLKTTDEVIMRTLTAVASKPWRDIRSVLAREMGTPPDERGLLLLDVIVAARRDPAVAQALRRAIDSHLDVLGTAAEAGVDAGLVDPALGVDDLSRLFSLLSFGMLAFTALGEEPPSEAAFARLVDLLLQSGDDDDVDDARPAALARVRTRAAVAERARRQLYDGIAAAIEAGHSLRQVGNVAGLSHERIRRLLQEREQERDARVGPVD